MLAELGAVATQKALTATPQEVPVPLPLQLLEATARVFRSPVDGLPEL
jgi:hypothetical protein